MQIHGFNKTTLLDYPGIVASGIFTGVCNLRCPFCQNSDLVLNPGMVPTIDEEEIFAHLRKRSGIIKGICISGGEPTLQSDLEEFIKKCKNLGVLVKLDTNGYRPEVLKKLVNKGLLDYVAMDIKSSFAGYKEAAGVMVDTGVIKESIDFLVEGHVDYEFRTTVVRELHDAEIMRDISEMITGAGKYYLQGYVDSERVIDRRFTAYTRKEMEEFLPIFSGKIKKVEIRGVD